MTDASRSEDWLPAWVRRRRESGVAEPALVRLRGASVAEGRIQAPALRDPRLLATPAPHQAALPANHAASPGQTRPFSTPPLSGRGGMQIRRLSEFSWGGAAKGLGGAAVPRVCPDHLVLWLTTGSIRIALPRQHRILRAGQMTFVPAGTAFSLWHGPVAEGVAVNIPISILRRLGMILPREMVWGTPDLRDQPILHAALPRLAQIGRLPDQASRVAALEPLGQLARALTRLDDGPTEEPHPKDDPRRAKPLSDRYIQLVRRDMGRGLTIADFAQELGVASATLDRACRCCRGRSALDLLYDLRLERAVWLLREGRNPTATVASLVGYVSLSHMNRAFAAATGRGPEAFRKGAD